MLSKFEKWLEQNQWFIKLLEFALCIYIAFELGRLSVLF